MDRRNAIMTLSGILATSAFIAAPGRQALAQTAVMPTTNATLTATQYKTQTLSMGTFAKQTSELAIAKATHPKIKQFAHFEVAEQTTIAQALMAMNNPPPAPLDSQHAALLKQLQEQPAKEFDAAYTKSH
jgi:predicted outer membrane protein